MVLTNRQAADKAKVRSIRLAVLLALPAVFLLSACAQRDDAEPGIVAGAQGIELFDGSYENALAKASAEDKLVMVDVYTTWCAPCKMMDLNVFTDPGVGSYFNDNFVVIKRDQEAEVFDGPELAGPNSVEVLPTYLILNGNGEHVDKGFGYFEPDAFVRFGRKMRGETDRLFAEMSARYESGERDLDFVRAYLVLASNNVPATQRSKEGWLFSFKQGKNYEAYKARRNLSDTINREDFALIWTYESGPKRDPKTVKFVTDNYARFVEFVPETSVAVYLLEDIKSTVAEKARAGDSSYVDDIARLDGDLAAAYSVQLETVHNDYLYKEYFEKLGQLHYEPTQQDWEALYASTEEMLAQKGQAVTAQDYTAAMQQFERAPDPEWRRKSMHYAKKALELEPAPMVAMTYMYHLQQAGDGEAAVQLGHKILAGRELDDGVDERAWDLFELTLFQLETELIQ